MTSETTIAKKQVERKLITIATQSQNKQITIRNETKEEVNREIKILYDEGNTNIKVIQPREHNLKQPRKQEFRIKLIKRVKASINKGKKESQHKMTKGTTISSGEGNKNPEPKQQ